MSIPTDFFRDRIELNSVLIVACFVSVLLLESQSAASYATYALAIAMLVKVREWNDVFRERIAWVVLALLSYLVLSSFWSEPFELRRFFSVFTRALLIFLFVVAFAECQLRGQLRRWLGRALAVVGVGAVIAAMTMHVITDPYDGRLNGLGQLDTHVVAALVFGVVLIFVLDVAMTDDSPRWRVLAAIAAVIIAIAVYLSDSRNAWVSVLLGATVFLLAHRIKDKQRFVVGALAVGVVLLIVVGALIVSESTREYVLPRGDSYRPVIWSSIVEDIQEQGAWFGLGINTPDDVTAGGMQFQHPHNVYLSIAHQGGLVALGLFLVLLALVASELVRSYGQRDAKLALGVLGIALPAYLLDGHDVVDKIGENWFLIWLPVSISLGLSWRTPVEQLE